MNRYDDIEFCANILYDYAYGNQVECYRVNYETKINIPIDQLKKNNNFNYSNVFDADIKYIKSNNVYDINDRYLFYRKPISGYPTLLKIYNYIDKESENKALIDMRMNYLLSDLALHDVYKYILLPIFNFDINNINDTNEEIYNIITV